METIVAVIGTLAGGVIFSLLTYVLQQRATHRERVWASEAERQQRRRGALEKRLGVIEESVNLMSECIDIQSASQFDLPTFSDASHTKEKSRRLEEIFAAARSGIFLTESEELKGNWNKLSRIYWDLAQTGVLESGQGKEASEAQVAIMRHLDEMRCD